MTAYSEIEPDVDDMAAVIQKPTNIDDLIELIKNIGNSTKK